MTQPLSQRLEARAVFHEFQIASLGPETIGAMRLVKDVELLREAAQLAKRVESAIPTHIYVLCNPSHGAPHNVYTVGSNMENPNRMLPLIGKDVLIMEVL